METYATRWSDERGAISPFIIIMFAALVGFAGLAYDGAQLFAAKREAVNVAAAAARAGANDIDEASIYDGDPVLAETAPGTAQQFALDQGMQTANAVEAEPTRIEVEVTQTVELTFLGAVGLGTQTIEARADARIRNGITEDS
jgi:Putative Flp pilus-assembly TadE/G-like